MQKFRPYLTIPDLQEIIRCMRKAPTQSPLLISYLEEFTRKSSAGIIQPQHVPTPKQSIESSLGFPVSASASANKLLEPITDLLIRWQEFPDSISPKELERINEHRYLHDMMDPGEASAYESSLLI